MIYKIIRIGNPSDSKLNHGKIFGGTYAFNKVPNSRNKTPRWIINNISRKIFTMLV